MNPVQVLHHTLRHALQHVMGRRSPPVVQPMPSSAPRYPLATPRSPARLPALNTKLDGVRPGYAGPCRAAPAATLRVIMLPEAGIAPASSGRMLISGRMDAVCAELDRLAAGQHTLH